MNKKEKARFSRAFSFAHKKIQNFSKKNVTIRRSELFYI